MAKVVSFTNNILNEKKRTKKASNRYNPIANIGCITPRDRTYALTQDQSIIRWVHEEQN